MGRLQPLSNERCSRQALFGCGFAAMVVVCLQLNSGVRHTSKLSGGASQLSNPVRGCRDNRCAAGARDPISTIALMGRVRAHSSGNPFRAGDDLHSRAFSHAAGRSIIRSDSGSCFTWGVTGNHCRRSPDGRCYVHDSLDRNQSLADRHCCRRALVAPPAPDCSASHRCLTNVAADERAC